MKIARRGERTAGPKEHLYMRLTRSLCPPHICRPILGIEVAVSFKRSAVLIPVVSFVICVSQSRVTAEAQSMSRTELKELIANANTPADYRKLAVFFHHQEQVYRARAAAEMDDYAHCVRNILMVPKFPTRADQTARLYDYYSGKADQQGKLASKYDSLLIRNGFAPVGNVESVSVKDLEPTPNSPNLHSAVMPKSKGQPRSQ